MKEDVPITETCCGKCARLHANTCPHGHNLNTKVASKDFAIHCISFVADYAGDNVESGGSL